MSAPALPDLRAVEASCDRALVVIATDPAMPQDPGAQALHRAGFAPGSAGTPLLHISADGQPRSEVRLDDPHDLETARLATATAVRQLADLGVDRCTVLLPEAAPALVQVIVEGALAANHRFVSTGPAADRRRAIGDLDFASADPKSVTAALRRGWLTSLASLTARDLATEPANALTPAAFRDRCADLAARAGFDLTAMARAELEAAGMQGILTVASGSAQDAFLICMDWRPDAASARKPLVLVGKTVTFDSGGISLKQAADMDHMKADMGGGAAVLGLMRMIAELRPAFPVSAIFAVVENMPGPDAMRPSDVIRCASGKTVEIINTDAEGRLILADALYYARGLNPAAVVDFATLTGATMGIFGPVGIGTFANDDRWFRALNRADLVATEHVWRLPLWRKYLDFLKSPVADLRNFSTLGQSGSTPTAAAFLSQFVGDHPWLHLDLYNTCWNPAAGGMMPIGPTGSGSRVMAQLILDLTQDGFPRSGDD